MRLLKLELMKLLRSPAIFGFLAVCLILNAIVVFTSSHKRQIDYLNDVAEITGNVYNGEYMEKLKDVPEPKADHFSHSERWLYEEMIQAAENARNVFANLKGGEEIHKKLLEDEGTYTNLTLQILRWKYAKLTPVIEEKAKRNDGDSVYFNGQSNYIHETVFGNVGKLLAAEVSVFFLLIILWALGFENMTGTGLVTYATKIGRKQVVHKITAAMLIGTAFFIIIYAVGYGLTFVVNDFSLVWKQNVSAQYHTNYDRFFGQVPFITWGSMTVGGYFYASVGIAFLNGVVVALFAVPFGLLVRNVYAAFCSVAGITFLHMMFYLFGLQTMGRVPFLWNLSLILPLTQLLNNTLWFSDGGTLMLLPHFESFYPFICILLLCPIYMVCIRKFARKEIV